MATKYLDLKVVLEPTLMQGVDYLARVQGVSGNKMLRELIKECLKNIEFDYRPKKASSHYVFRRDGTL